MEAPAETCECWRISDFLWNVWEYKRVNQNIKDRIMLSVEYLPMQYYDAIIVSFNDDEGNAHNIIVDGGEVKSPKYCYTERLKGKLEKIFSKVETIDLWVITHIDDDHIGGLFHFINDAEFFERYHQQLKEVWINYGGKGDYGVQRTGTIGYHGGKKLRDVLHEKNVCVKEGIKAGYSISMGNAGITVIAPDDNSYKRYIEWWNGKEFKENVETNDGLILGGDWDYDKKIKDFDMYRYDEDKEVKNNSSIAFVLSYHNHRVLFSADSCSTILMKGLKDAHFLKDGGTKLDLMQIPHHGSNRNSSCDFLKCIECPQYVITGNGENKHKLPDKETIARLVAANPEGCELHFSCHNNKLREIFEDEEKLNLKVCYEAKFEFE